MKGATTSVIRRVQKLGKLPLRSYDDLLVAIEDALSLVRHEGAQPDRLALIQLQAVREAREILKISKHTHSMEPSLREKVLRQLWEQGEPGITSDGDAAV